MWSTKRQSLSIHVHTGRITSGIKLVGSEVKSIRQGKVSISEGYCYFNDGELFIKGMTISDYGYGSSHDYK